MKTKPMLRRVTFATLLLVTIGPQLPSAQAQGTAFTYQGRLNTGGGPASGVYDFQFALYNAASGGSQLSGTVTDLAVGVTNGLFTTTVDFGVSSSLFSTGIPLWLAINVRTNGVGSYAGLTPLQQLTPSPYAIFAETASAPGLVGAIPNNSLPGLQSPWETVSGGQNNQATASYSTVSGGNVNTASGTDSTVGGGYNNTAGNFSTVGGGYQNSATSAAIGDATVAGGTGNHATNDFASIGGGQYNIAGGAYSTVPGGGGNIATGTYSFAAGQQAQALNQGALVWADSQNTAFASTNNDSFNVRARGGARFVTSGAGLSVDAQPVFTGNNGAGLTNVNATTLNGVAGTNFWQLGGNTVASNQFLGSLNNSPLVFLANNQRALRLENVGFPVFYLGLNIGNEESVNVVAGFASNYVAPGIIGGTICGGGNSTPQPIFAPIINANRVLGNYGSVLGGAGNTASGGNSVVMGSLSTAAGFCSVSLGNQTDANSDFSFAAGNNAQAANTGAFVWADSQNAAFASTNTNSFNVRANGGVFFVTSGAGMTLDGPLVVTGSGADPSSAAFGSSALQKNTSGQANTAIGVATLSSNTIGSFNVAVGEQALYQNTSGDYNVAIGNAALANNTIGSDNTALGLNALAGLLGGANNIAVGSSAGLNLSGNESNNIYIGNPGVTGESNAIRIGTPGTQTTAFIAGATTVSNSGAAISFNVFGSRTGDFSSPVALIQNLSSSASSSPALRIVGGANSPDGALSVSSSAAPGTANSVIAQFGNSLFFALIITNDGSLYSTGDVYARGTKLTSDRNAKEHFAALDVTSVLEKVAALPVSEWNYRNDSAETRHIGPVAQDFHEAFGLDGADDKHISVVDEGGVALAAIQGLNQKVEEKANRIQDQELRIQNQAAEIMELKQKNGVLAEQLNRLEATVKALANRK